MENNKEFDSYIKGLFDEDPKVPSELEWEAMDFELPVTNEQKTKKQNRDRFLLLLFLVFTGIAIALFKTNKKEDITAQHISAINDKQANQEQIQKEQANRIAIPSNTLSTPLSSEGKQHTEIHQASPAPSNTVPNNSLNELAAPPLQSTLTVVPLENAISTKQSENSLQADPSKNITVDPLIAAPHFKKVLTPPTSITSLDMLQRKKFHVHLQQKFPFPFNPIWLPSADSEQNHSIKLSELLIGYGLSQFKLDIDTSNILNSKLTSILSHSFSAGIGLDIRKNWNLRVHLKYDQYHTTFEHTRELEPIEDLQNSVQIYRTEVTFHNNYTNTLGLQLGIARKWKLSNRLQVRTGLNLVPIYTFSVLGKTAEDSLVKDLTYDDQISRFALQGGLEIGVVYPINPVIHLEMTYQFNQFLLNEIFINDHVNTRQGQSMLLRIAYQL